MLDYCGYVGDNMSRRHIIDNSCGDGAFLCEAVERYCRCYLARKHSAEGLRAELQQYVHGIEIDGKAWSNCLFNLDNVAAAFGVKGVRWDVVNADMLTVTRYDGLMDYVVGNPPYVRVHNLAENYSAVKAFHFANGAMTDLYLVFFEIGLRMLSPLLTAALHNACLVVEQPRRHKYAPLHLQSRQPDRLLYYCSGHRADTTVVVSAGASSLGKAVPAAKTPKDVSMAGSSKFRYSIHSSSLMML